jgi:hypothetical protein
VEFISSKTKVSVLSSDYNGRSVFFYLLLLFFVYLTPITCVSHFLCMEQLSGISATECFNCENFE